MRSRFVLLFLVSAFSAPAAALELAPYRAARINGTKIIPAAGKRYFVGPGTPYLLPGEHGSFDPEAFIRSMSAEDIANAEVLPEITTAPAQTPLLYGAISAVDNKVRSIWGHAVRKAAAEATSIICKQSAGQGRCRTITIEGSQWAVAIYCVRSGQSIDIVGWGTSAESAILNTYHGVMVFAKENCKVSAIIAADGAQQTYNGQSIRIRKKKSRV